MSRILKILAIAIFGGFLAVEGYLNVPCVQNSLPKRGFEWSKFVTKARENYRSTFYGKNRWIDGNGLYARLTGRRLQNGALAYRRGMLGYPRHVKTKTICQVKGLSEWKEFVERQGAKLLYVQVPTKIDRACELLPLGADPAQHTLFADGDRMVAELREKGICCLDFCDELAGTADKVCRNFYRTDHHWRHEAVFSVFPRVAGEIAALAGKRLETGAFDPANWQEHSFPRDYLGSGGRRTGSGFCGYDDFTYRTPKFKTDIDFRIPAKKFHRWGSFEQSIVDPRVTMEHVDPYRACRYHVYCGSSHKFMCIRSRLAPCKLRLLIVKDSFAVPMIGLLSTVFSEIDVIDPRDFKGRISEHVLKFKPDVVMFFVNTIALDSPTFYSFVPPQAR